MPVNLFLKNIQDYHENLDLDFLSGVFSIADQKHSDCAKDISETYELISLLLPFKPDLQTIFAALFLSVYLTDDVDDTEITELCGADVVTILAGLKKLEYLKYSENDRSSQIEIFRKMFFAMAKDMRVVLIVLANRLYLMEHLENLDEKEKILAARETLDVYVPIASRLCVYRIKTSLEDLAFKYTNPSDYDELAWELDKFDKSKKQTMEIVKSNLEEFLLARGFEVEISGRIKSIYSIYRKLKRKNLVSVNDLYDIFAMRIIVKTKGDADSDNVEQLYRILGMIHSQWSPMSKRFKDYVAIPKPNGYRSLHTVVLGLALNDMDQAVEIQIRSDSMHEEAEYGVASHWIYKQVGSNNTEAIIKSQSDWLRGLKELQYPLSSESELVKEVELDIFKDRIFVLTPRGEVKDLPAGSCPIDFAYYVHTDVGNSCVMAKVDGNVVPLDYELRNGDVVKIVTKNGGQPKLEWLSIVKTGLARNKIKAWFSSLNSEQHLRDGRLLLNEQLLKISQPILDQNYSILKSYLGKKLNLSEREQLIEEVGKGAQFASDIIRNVYPSSRNITNDVDTYVFDSNMFSDNLHLEGRVLVGGESGLPVKFAGCCSPKLSVPILAYVTRGNRITIHLKECALLKSLDNRRVLPASWIEEA
jgi:GTP pyrophosphokinase